MSNYIYQNYSQNDRITMLQNQAKKSEVKTYNRSLSEEEINREKDKYASDAIELDRQKKDLKSTVERLKAGITSVETLMEERLEKIKTGQTEITATLYGLPDYNKNRMNWYDGYGERINSLPLTPDERQGTLFIGDAPAEDGAIAEEPTYVDFDENPLAAPGDVAVENAVPLDGSQEFVAALDNADEAYQKSVDEMYDGETIPGNVEIQQGDPVEDKPAKRTSVNGTGKNRKKNQPKGTDPI